MSATIEACAMPKDAVLGGGLDEQREPELLRFHETSCRAETIETRALQCDARPATCFGQDFVARQHQAARIAARVALPHHFEVSDDVLVVRRDPGKVLEQVENDVWLEVANRLAQLC